MARPSLGLSITKRVRMDRPTAKRLADLARARHTTESQVIRDGVALVARQLRQGQALREFADLYGGPEEPKARFRLR
jgi:predicted transcriptional regulator